jgi:hypothetical protein
VRDPDATHVLLPQLVVQGRRRRGFEFKRTDAPAATKSMHLATQDLGLDSIDVIHTGGATYPLTKGIRALSISRVHAELGGARRVVRA